MELDDGPPTGGFDRAQCFGCSSRVAIHHPSGTSGLHPDHAHVVGHDVVELAGDSHPFGEHGLPGVLLPLGLELDGLIGELSLTISQGPYGRTKQPGKGDHDHVVEEGEGRASGGPCSHNW